MTEAKHTPGPWFRNIKPASKYCTVFAGRSTHVAVVCTQGLTEDEIEANTDLIAAAPDLLAALKEVICRLCHCRIGWTGGGGMRPPDCPGCRDARAAIAKAEGRQP